LNLGFGYWGSILLVRLCSWLVVILFFFFFFSASINALWFKPQYISVRRRYMVQWFNEQSDKLSRHVVFYESLPMPYWSSVVYTPVLPLSSAPPSRRKTF
jgi:hypothetical protein